jgi:hypothetical protein
VRDAEVPAARSSRGTLAEVEWSSGRRRCDGAPSVGTPGFDSWTHEDPSMVALVGWKVVEQWVCAGVEARHGGARRSEMEAALGCGEVGCRGVVGASYGGAEDPG